MAVGIVGFGYRAAHLFEQVEVGSEVVGGG